MIYWELPLGHFPVCFLSSKTIKKLTECKDSHKNADCEVNLLFLEHFQELFHVTVLLEPQLCFLLINTFIFVYYSSSTFMPAGEIFTACLETY